MPCGHSQALLTQTLPPPQRLPQPLQLVALVRVSTQAPPQFVSPCGHWHVPEQSLPPVHAVPQPPQLALSESVLTQVWPQRTSPMAHPASGAPSPEAPSSALDASTLASGTSPSDRTDTSDPGPASNETSLPSPA